MTLSKEKIYGITGAVIGCILLLLILLLVYMPEYYHDNVLDEGVMVSFGDAADGGGNDLNVQETYMPPTATQAPKPAVTQKLPSEQDLMTQKNTSPVKVTETKKTSVNKNAEADLQRREEQRLAAEQQRRAAAEQQRRAQAASTAQNVIGGAFGSSGGSGSGTTSGDTRQGNPAGSGVSGGNSWSLNGRSLSGTLVKPSYSSNVEGKITVSIRVDANGNVTSASVVSPSTISDASMRSGAITAARQTKFSGGSGVAIGTITYNYRLN